MSDDRRGHTEAQNRAQRRAALQARTRGGLDGLGFVDIETALTHHRQHAGGAPAGSEEAADLHAIQCAYEDVLAWMVETDACVYHGQLR